MTGVDLRLLRSRYANSANSPTSANCWKRRLPGLSLADGDDAWESHVVAALHRVMKLRASLSRENVSRDEGVGRHNEAFQETLASGCSSVWLLNFRRAAYFYAKRYFRVCLSATAMRDLQKDQRAMADAAIGRDITKLQGLIENQLERTYRKIEASGKAQIAPLYAARQRKQLQFLLRDRRRRSTADFHPWRDAWHGAVRRTDAVFFAPVPVPNL